MLKTSLEPRKIRAKTLLSRAADVWIPACPSKVRAVIALCGDRYVSADKIAGLIAEDYGLSFRLFRLMNSAFFSVQRKDLVSIKYIVVLLGLENIVKAVSRTPIARIPRSPGPEDCSLFFMALGVLSGKLAGVIARPLGIDHERAAVVSMFRNLGQVVSSITIPETVISCLDNAGTFLDEAAFKRACGGYTTETLAFELARNWNMPELIRLAIWPSRFTLEKRAADERIVLELAVLIRDLVNAGLTRGKKDQKMHRVKDAFKDTFDLDAKILDQILFDLRTDFAANRNPYYYLLESKGLFGCLLNG